MDGIVGTSAPRSDPEVTMSSLVPRLIAIVGQRHVLTGSARTSHFAKGFRVGSGPVLAVVRPGTLVEQWRLLRECVSAGVIIIMQAANTSLTGGSAPYGEYDRDVVVINTMRICGVHILNGGRQVVCLPGTTLFELERALKAVGREPHSVIGSSCIGASVFGGICNNSGGSLVRRGPAYTELALFARVDTQGSIHLVNHLGIHLGDDPESILESIQRGQFGGDQIEYLTDRSASDHDYANHVRQIDEATPARFNADPSRLFEASGSAGKVMLFAARLDTFPKDNRTTVFYIGTNNTMELTRLRRDMLAKFSSLPVAGEYMHRTAFDIAETYGKDMFLAIKYLGTDRLPLMFTIKRWIDDAAKFIPFFSPSFE